MDPNIADIASYHGQITQILLQDLFSKIIHAAHLCPKSSLSIILKIPGNHFGIRRALERRAVCGVITLTPTDEDDPLAGEAIPTPEDVRAAVESLVQTLPSRVVHSVELKRLVPDTKDTLRERAEDWNDDDDDDDL